mmetsp:Transcript_43338/g.94859  ORF Transcript_43338/g.94859 Transcript_43338/m.94859 type:complete len:299 (-) Transcript_43338:1013-1909(-)
MRACGSCGPCSEWLGSRLANCTRLCPQRLRRRSGARAPARSTRCLGGCRCDHARHPPARARCLSIVASSSAAYHRRPAPRRLLSCCVRHAACSRPKPRHRHRRRRRFLPQRRRSPRRHQPRRLRPAVRRSASLFAAAQWPLPTSRPTWAPLQPTAPPPPPRAPPPPPAPLRPLPHLLPRPPSVAALLQRRRRPLRNRSRRRFSWYRAATLIGWSRRHQLTPSRSLLRRASVHSNRHHHPQLVQTLRTHRLYSFRLDCFHHRRYSCRCECSLHSGRRDLRQPLERSSNSPSRQPPPPPQ